MAPNRARFAIVLTVLALLVLWATLQADTGRQPPTLALLDSTWRGDSVDTPSRDDATTTDFASQADDSSGASTLDTAQTPLGRDGQPLTDEQIALGAKIRKTLATYEAKRLNARDHSSWEVMHGLIAFGPRTQIYRDGPGGTTVNAIGWLLWGGRCQGQPLIMLENNHPHALRGVGLQGHDGQYLAMLAQWRVRPENPMQISGKEFTIADYIEEEKATCQSGAELTFKLIALSHYLPSDARWKSRYGEEWTIPKLLKAEIEAPIHGAACGGTHRLFAISNAVKERKRRGEPIDGQYARAEKYMVDYQRYTVGSLQNPDGSFSTEWFKYAADRSGDLDRKLQTTGHILEWLAWSLPDEDLRHPRVTKTVDFLSGTLNDNPNRAWSIGPLGHALHALMIYHQRLYTEPPLPESSLAAQPISLRKSPFDSWQSVQAPPEPECEDNVEAQPKAEPHKVAEESDDCIEASQLHEAIRQALRGASPTAGPVAIPARATR